MVSVYSKIVRKSKCFAEEELGKPMGSLEDTPIAKATLFTLWPMVGLLEWAPMFSTQSKDKKSTTAARVRKAKQCTRSSATASRVK